MLSRQVNCATNDNADNGVRSNRALGLMNNQSRLKGSRMDLMCAKTGSNEKTLDIESKEGQQD